LRHSVLVEIVNFPNGRGGCGMTLIDCCFRLWLAVSDSIMRWDQTTATNEKCLLEEEQRRLSRERKAKMEEWRPRLFERNLMTGDWVYKYAE